MQGFKARNHWICKDSTPWILKHVGPWIFKESYPRFINSSKYIYIYVYMGIKYIGIWIYVFAYIYIYIYIYMGVSRLSRCRESVPKPLCKRGPMGPVGPKGPTGPWGQWAPWAPMGPWGPRGPWGPWASSAPWAGPHLRNGVGVREQTRNAYIYRYNVFASWSPSLRTMPIRKPGMRTWLPLPAPGQWTVLLATSCTGQASCRAGRIEEYSVNKKTGSY